MIFTDKTTALSDSIYCLASEIDDNNFFDGLDISVISSCGALFSFC